MDRRVPEFGTQSESTVSADGCRLAQEGEDPARLDYREADRPLIEEMRTMIQRGMAKNATDAARGIARRASGRGTDASKVTRLAGGYLRQYPPELARIQRVQS